MIPLVSPAALKEESWIEVRSPHFRIYSDAGETKARRLTHEFEKFHALIRLFIPSIQVGPGIPTIVLAAKDEKSLRSLLPQFWENKGQAHPSGLFVRGPEKNYVALRLDMEEDYRYHIVYHEYVHLMLRLNYSNLPVWLSEGLAECLGYSVISGDWSKVGKPSPYHLNILRNRRPIPIAEFFAVDRESPHYREESKVSLFYAQSWALTHMLLLGEKRVHAPKLFKYLELNRERAPMEEAIAQAFGDLKELERLLNEYILHMNFYTFMVETPSATDPEEYLARKVPPLEIRTVSGDFFVSTQHWSEAKEVLDSVLSEDPGNTQALTSMGIYHISQNQREEAEKFFIMAANAGSKSPITHYYAGDAAMQSRDYERAETSFRKAIELNPGFAASFSQLAVILAMKDETANTALKFALKAVELEPSVLSHQLVLANTLMHLGEVDMAIQYAENAETAAESSQDRMEAERFLSMARRYRDSVSELEKMKEEIGQSVPFMQSEQNETDSQVDPDIAREKQQEEIEREFGARENKKERILKERADAYEKREKIELEYLNVIRSVDPEATITLEGIVSDVYCFDPAGIELTVEADGNLHKLHVSNYFEIRFTAKNHKPDGELKPCTDLLGIKVSSEFIPTPGAAYDGEVLDIGIYKAEQKSDIP